MEPNVAIVTGGAAGIGKATVELLIEDGYIVIVSDIDEASGNETVNALNTPGGEAVFHRADVSQFEEVKALVDATVARFGRLDLMVNNAGIGPKQFQRTAEHSLEDWEKIIAVNQSGVFYGMKVALGHMMQQGHGNIVNVSSLAGIKGSGTGMAYTASKFAVVGMTKTAALEYGSKNIRINCVCPSYTETQLVNQYTNVDPNEKAKALRFIPMKRFDLPEEIAQAICWLGSDQSSFVTGHAMVVDGGVAA